MSRTHRSQIDVTNMIITRKFEIVGESPKGDPETQSEEMLLDSGARRLGQRGAATNLQFVKMQDLQSTIEPNAVT